MYYFPAGLPKALQSGYQRQHKPNILRTSMADGYSRQRLINQGAPDVLTVSWMLTGDDYVSFLAWYKGNVHCGADWFVMPVVGTSVDGVSYQYCRMQNGQFTASLQFRNGAGSCYKISATLDVSNTVVDDGTWEDHYTGTSNEDFGTVSSEYDANDNNVYTTAVVEDTNLGENGTAEINYDENDLDLSIKEVLEESNLGDYGTVATAEAADTYDEVK